MDKSVLELYSDKFIPNDSLKTEEEEFFRLLPDELLTLTQTQKQLMCTETKQTADVQSRTVPPQRCTRLNYSSQNPTEADERPGGSLEQEPVPPSMPVTPKTEQPKIIPKIRNILSTVSLGCGLDLDFIANNLWNVEYKPKKFNPLIMRIREPRTTALIYNSGKLVCTGATSAQQSRLAARKFARKVQKLGFPVRFLNFKIHNFFACCETFPVNLMELASHQSCSYEPEMFPAGVFFRGIPDITVIITQSGKISLTGTKDEAKIYKAVDTIWPILQRFRRS